MWAPAAAVLVKHHTVVVPDLRGMGLSAHPDMGYTKKNQAVDIVGVMDALKIDQADLVTHDIGNMVGYALAAQYSARITKWVVIDALLPGIGKKIDEATRQHYAALYARPHAMHDAFEQFGAFNQDAVDNKALLAKVGKLAMPVLAVGAEKSFGTAEADTLRFVATNVTTGIVPGSGHWIMDENPAATTAVIVNFLSK